MINQYDVIVVGGGHAGLEAALAAARMGVNTLLITQNIETLGQMSCNPAIGGIGKGHLVKEIDALNGIMALAADKSGIHFRRLNASKGPAVRATRVQADRALYRASIRYALENQENLTLFQQTIDDLIIENHRVQGVLTRIGVTFHAKAVVLTVGTFLDGLIHVGLAHYPGGRAGDPPADLLSEKLRSYNLKVDRLKTGTPPRIDKRSVDFSCLTEQPGDSPRPVFSVWANESIHPSQISCYITHTNEKTHQIIRQGLDRSPLYTGKIEGAGPRYCPSIEDKIIRFADRNSHQIFIEPEGLNSNELYPNGISTSLPYDIQCDLVQSIKGFEKAHITRPGYAIEYDFFDPRELKPTLETKAIESLFFAGQINGTTGYEEAGAQGLIAGLNAARMAMQKTTWYPQRNQAYIGVLIDDLITCGTNEPYRMFTSRAEHRLLLREDNADLRLTEQGYQLGLVSQQQWKIFNQKQEMIEKEKQRLKSTWLHPGSLAEKDQQLLLNNLLTKEATLFNLLSRPSVNYFSMMEVLIKQEIVTSVEITPVVAEQLEIQSKYEGYIKRQEQEIERQKKHELMELPERIDYDKVHGLSNEVRQKLKKIRPLTLGQAARISGVTPAAISLILVHLKKRNQNV